MSAEETAVDARYPMGKFRRPAVLDEPARKSAMKDLAELPALLRSAVEGMNDAQLATPYREGGWTVRQVVHHIADSHMNAFVRVRKALTEENPVISVYEEKAWAELPDSQAAPVKWSLALLENLHARWVMMLQGLSEEQWKRTFVHPENGLMAVELATAMYAWHGKHHLAHVRQVRPDAGRAVTS